MNSKKYGFFSMGVPLLLTVVLVLMLTTFSLLSLSAARSGLERARLLAERTQCYYEADSQARLVLARLRAGEDPGLTVTAEEGLLHYRIPLGEDQSLWVTLRQEDLTVLRWQTVND